MSKGELIESQWTDDYGDHIEISARGPDGRVWSKTVTRNPIWGWGIDLVEARRSVTIASATALQQGAPDAD